MSSTPPDLPAYAELQSVTNFTFLRGASHAEELAARAASLGYSALAITDACPAAAWSNGTRMTSMRCAS